MRYGNGSQLQGVKMYYLNISSPLESEFRVREAEQVSTLFQKMPPRYLDGFKRAKRAFYGCVDYPLSFAVPRMRGFRLVVNGLVPRVDSIIAAHRDRVRAQFFALGPIYDQMVEESRRNLGDHAPNYPSWEEVCAGFQCQAICLTLAETPVAPGLMGLSALVGEIRQEAYTSLTVGFQTLVREMVVRLLEGKTFRDSSIEKFGQFLADFSHLAEVIKGADYDADLDGFKALVTQAREAMRGVVPDALRGKDNADFRESVGNALNTVGRGLDNLMALPVGARRLNLGGSPSPPPPPPPPPASGQPGLFGGE